MTPVLLCTAVLTLETPPAAARCPWPASAASEHIMNLLCATTQKKKEALKTMHCKRLPTPTERTHIPPHNTLSRMHSRIFAKWQKISLLRAHHITARTALPPSPTHPCMHAVTVTVKYIEDKGQEAAIQRLHFATQLASLHNGRLAKRGFSLGNVVAALGAPHAEEMGGEQRWVRSTLLWNVWD